VRRAPIHAAGDQSAVKLLDIFEVTTPAEAIGVQQPASSDLQSNSGALNIMNLCRPRGRRPLDVDLSTHECSSLGGPRMLENLV
jgi:hypothetical protein